ncbi:rolling circle replication-associated protein [Elizabethkingia anophelis]|uniref:rolling circle replication-associated protein n=1 Tax=Elizabethkingia anophelis TaxID=1117645 RepID=UPI0011EAEFBF|nr:hypothetical protein [Elizabethkingia anophelis]TYT29967.1 hypothetical protein FZC31_07045 [Elizabethkingia anophelis]UKY90269.1 hypothetical protein KUF64_00700 [Elizabethkingia anophelis]UKY97438.1 hypothetical protein KUF68_00700 [Elizabethkingia anophelis]
MCLTPINLKKTGASSNSYVTQQVPCNKCLECRKRRTNSWFARLTEQLKVSDTAFFVTLTYDDMYLPFSPNGLMTLDYRDFQLFMKRARKLQKKKISYFLVGEYGSQTHRPHYHAIVFDVDNISKFLNEWRKGHTHAGTVTHKSIYYTLKYCTKSVVDDSKDKPSDSKFTVELDDGASVSYLISSDSDDDRKPEKALMSKALGLSHLTTSIIAYYKDDVTRNFSLLGGRTIPLPRYYRDKVFSDDEKVRRSIAIYDYLEKRYERISDPLFPQRVRKMYDKVYESIKQTD